MTDTKEVKAVDPRLTDTQTKLSAVKTSVRKLLTINERAAAADAEAATAAAQMVAVLTGQSTEGEQDVSVLLKARDKATKLAAKIRDSAGVYARDIHVAIDSLKEQANGLTAGIEIAAVSDEPKLGDEDGETDTDTDNEQDEEEIDA